MTDSTKSPIEKFAKGNLKRDFKTIFLVGNGAIQGVNESLLSDLDQVMPFHRQLQPNSQDGRDDFCFVYWGLLARAGWAYMLKSTQTEAGFSGANSLIENKLTLGQQLVSRDFKRRMLSRDHESLLNADDTLVLSFNWDKTLWEDESIKNIWQLHGSCHSPLSMVMPGETLLDSRFYESCEFQQTRASDGTQLIFPKDDFRIMRALHGSAIDKIAKAEVLVSWGLHLHAYDAEVTALLAQAREDVKNKSGLRIECINPLMEPGWRLTALLGRDRFIHTNPLNGTSNEIRFTQVVSTPPS